MQKTYRYRIYPSADQEEKIGQWLNTCRYLYNNSLAERTEAYERDNISINYYDQANALREAKKTDEWLQNVHSQVLQDVLRRLDKAFRNFFRRVKNSEKPGYPRFKSKDRFNSFTFPQSGFDIEGGKLILSKIGAIKLIQHREIVELVSPNGTSQICSRCGVEIKKTLAVRTHKCPYCGLVMDRDENAALNILNR